MLYLRSASTPEIRGNWKFIEHGLEKVIEKGAGEFIPADIYAAIIARTTFLYWVEDPYYLEGSKAAGFVVLSEVNTSYDGVKSLFVEQAYIRPEAGRETLMDELVNSLADLAKQVECGRVEFSSPRMGWGRKLRKFGFSPISVNYELRI